VTTQLAERTLFERAQVEQTVDTTTAAALIHKRPQTLRRWACEGSGPIQPVRIHGRLHWSLAKLRALAEHGSEQAA
jgi:hypothetical protein